MIGVELRKMLRSRRTWVTIGIIDLLPSLVAVLLAVTEVGPRPGTGPAFLSAVLSNGALYPLAAIAIILPLFLPAAVAITAGETIAGEAQQGTLRYVLIRPVGRTRLLVAKLRLGDGLRAGHAARGRGDGVRPRRPAARRPERDHEQRDHHVLRDLADHAAAARSAPASRSPTPSCRCWASPPSPCSCRRWCARRWPPRWARLALLIGSSLLLTLDAAHGLQPYLVTRYWLAFVDLFRDPIRWHDVVHGVVLQAGYVVIFLGAAWANFVTKDITD